MTIKEAHELLKEADWAQEGDKLWYNPGGVVYAEVVPLHKYIDFDAPVALDALELSAFAQLLYGE